MPDQPDDDHLVPPLKVMRKRLNGVYRADSGFSGPTRRYVLIVALLVGLASLPTLAAITAGTHQLADGNTDTMDIPVLPPASPGPVRGSGPPASAGTPADEGPADGSSGLGPGTAPGGSDDSAAGEPSAPPRQQRPGTGPSVPGASGGLPPRGPASGASGDATSGEPDSAGRANGQVGRRQVRPEPARPDSTTKRPSAGKSGKKRRELIYRDHHPGKTGHSRSPSAGKAGHSPGANDADDAADRGNVKAVTPDDSGSEDPDQSPAWADRPSCHERGKCARASHHHRPDRTRHRQCANSTHRAHWSHHRTGNTRTITVHIDPAGRHERTEESGRHDRADKSVRHERAGQHHRVGQNTVKHRSKNRSERSRRAAVAERPQNIRAATILALSYGQDNRRVIPAARGEDNTNHSYRGSHRAGSVHHDEDQTPAQQRNSRVGRHHADPGDDVNHRW